MIDGPDSRFTSIEKAASTRAENYFLDLCRSGKATVIASRPVLEARGLEGIIQTGMTEPELHYAAQAVDKHLIETFERNYFEPLHLRVDMYAFGKDPYHLAAVLREIEIMQRMIPELAAKGENYTLVCTDGKKATWPAVATQKTEDVLKLAGEVTNKVLDEILLGIENASPSVRDDKLKRAGKYLTGHGDHNSLCAAIQNVQLPIKESHREKVQEFSHIMVVHPPKEGAQDSFEALLKEEKSYLKQSVLEFRDGVKNTTGAWLFLWAIAAGVLGLGLIPTPRHNYLEKITPSLESIQTIGIYSLAAIAGVGTLYATSSAGLEFFNRHTNRKTITQYAQALGKDFYNFSNIPPMPPQSLTTAQRLKEEVLFRVEYILNEHSGRFVNIDELQQRVFPRKKQGELYYTNNLIHHAASLLSMREDIIIEGRNNVSDAYREYRVMKKEKMAA